jgi:nitroreductase
MDLDDAICGRRAVRRYKLDMPTEKILRRLIEAAVQAPSAMDEPQWHFTVITRPDMLDQISAGAKAWIKDDEPWLADNDKLRALLRDPDFHMLHHAPVLIVISAPVGAKWSTEGCAAAAQNLMLAATGQGLGSCWIGLARNWLNSPQGRQLIELPADERVLAPIVVGYASEEPAAVARPAPRITWMDETIFTEEGERAETASVPGIFGGLVRSHQAN